MKLVYLDQNIISGLKNKRCTNEIQCFEDLTKRRDLKFVLSPWHWVEAAGFIKEAEAKQAAEFLDSIQSWWLHERTVIEEREMLAYLNGSPGTVVAVAHSKSEIAHELRPFPFINIITRSYEMVKALRHSPKARSALQSAYEVNEVAFKRNVQLVKSGQLKKEHAWTGFVQGLAKLLHLDPNKFERADKNAFRTITAEFEAGWLRWERGSENPDMRLSHGHLKDSFHIVVALPYVHRFVCQDKRLIKFFNAVRQKLPFVTAEAASSLTELV